MTEIEICRLVAKDFGVTLHEVQRGDKFCQANGYDEYDNRSWVAGHEIWLGIYKNKRQMLLHFFHEMGHILRLTPYIEGYDTWDFEKFATEAGYQLARQYGISFTKKAMVKFAEDQKKSYQNYQ